MRHHARSERNSRLRRSGHGHRGCIGTPSSRLIIRRRKERPDLTTLQAWFRRPSSNSSSRREQAFRSPHSLSSVCRRWSLSAGRRSLAAMVSTSIPRKVRHAVGPSRLCSAIGTPSLAHDDIRVVSHSAHS